MFQYRQVLVRLRAGDAVREVARSGLMGRDKLGELRSVAEQHGWLDAARAVPDDAAIAAALGFVWDPSSATWLGCHRRAFEWFDGVPLRLIIDNAKCAIVKACTHDPRVQCAYAECAGCAEGSSFKIDACPPGDPQKKGIVESGVKYLKGNFLPTREFCNLDDLNAQARTWVMSEAGARVHGTTCEQPLVLFEAERPLLRRLPLAAPDLGTWHRVVLLRDCHVQFDKSLYSAPFTLVGKSLRLRATDMPVALYGDYRHLCTHLRALRAGQRVTVMDHLPPDAQAFFERDQQWCVRQATSVGPHCVELVALLLGDRIAEQQRAAQGVIGCAKTYGTARLEAACERALGHNSPHYRTVKRSWPPAPTCSPWSNPRPRRPTPGPASHAARSSCSAPMRPRSIDAPRRTAAKPRLDDALRHNTTHRERQHIELQPDPRACPPTQAAAPVRHP